jgi:soluble lytic murein transglycosylase
LSPFLVYLASFLFLSVSFAASKNNIGKYTKWKIAITDPKNYVNVFSFFYNNPHWPLFEKSVKIAEKSIDDKASDSLVLKWFKRYSPKTSHGISSYANYLLKNDTKLGKEFIKKTWIFQNLSIKFAKKYRGDFKRYLSPVEDALRVKYLIKQTRIKDLKSMKGYVDSTIKTYIDQYLNKYFMSKSGKFSTNDIEDPDKRYLIVQNYIDQKNDKKAADVLILTNSGEDDIKFFNQRRHVASNILRLNEPEIAYKIMKMHKLNSKSSDENLAKAEWLLGYIAFRFLNQPKVAILHFETAYNNSKKAIRLSKNAFWMAEVCRNQNDILLALNWYRKASIHFSTFYGYIANERLHDMSKGFFSIADDFYDADKTNIPAETEMVFYNRELVETLLSIENYEKDKEIVKCFYEQLIKEIEDPHEETLLLNLPHVEDNISVLVTTSSRKQHYFSNKKAYKVLNEEDMKHVYKISKAPCFVSLVHSIILRESGFNQQARSHAGAIGLMQIMPATASYEAKRISFYIGGKSLFDKQKNITIGAWILNRLMKKYKNNMVFAIAAYNCGEGNLSKYQKSIKKLQNLTPLDIMELIPIKETRIYVKHVMRNMFTYQKMFKAPETCYIQSELLW